eukprot:1998367-Pyramimonas_sp.AAC.1
MALLGLEPEGAAAGAEHFEPGAGRAQRALPAGPDGGVLAGAVPVRAAGAGGAGGARQDHASGGGHVPLAHPLAAGTNPTRPQIHPLDP